MKFKYQIYKEHGLIIEVVTGHVTLESLADKTKTLFADADYDSSYVGIADYRLASPQITRAEVYGFAKFINDSDQFGKSKWAIIADDPMVVALSQIFQQRLINTDVISVFATIEAAAMHVGKPVALNYIEKDIVI